MLRKWEGGEVRERRKRREKSQQVTTRAGEREREK